MCHSRISAFRLLPSSRSRCSPSLIPGAISRLYPPHLFPASWRICKILLVFHPSVKTKSLSVQSEYTNRRSSSCSSVWHSQMARFSWKVWEHELFFYTFFWTSPLHAYKGTSITITYALLSSSEGVPFISLVSLLPRLRLAFSLSLRPTFRLMCFFSLAVRLAEDQRHRSNMDCPGLSNYPENPWSEAMVLVIDAWLAGCLPAG